LNIWSVINVYVNVTLVSELSILNVWSVINVNVNVILDSEANCVECLKFEQCLCDVTLVSEPIILNICGGIEVWSMFMWMLH
jgi:hypothetical protein